MWRCSPCARATPPLFLAGGSSSATAPTMAIEATLTVVLSPGGEILLGRKARGFGVGKLCGGFGGKLQHGETAAAAALRELLEETTIECGDFEALQKHGRLFFSFPDAFELVLHVYVCRLKGSSLLVEARGDEFERPLRWCAIDDIPYGEMWPDAAVWLPRACVLGGGEFEMRFRYEAMDGEGGITVLD